MNLSRTLIIGNSGSGKSWLAKRVAEQLHAPWSDLDQIHWVSDEYSIARPRADALAMARVAADEPRWVIEGVYGWIVSELIHRATALVWLCVDDDACVANIRQRENRQDDDALLMALLEGAASYRLREDSCGFNAHRQLFEGFSGSKIKLVDWADVSAFANSLLQPE